MRAPERIPRRMEGPVEWVMPRSLLARYRFYRLFFYPFPNNLEARFPSSPGVSLVKGCNFYTTRRNRGSEDGGYRFSFNSIIETFLVLSIYFPSESVTGLGHSRPFAQFFPQRHDWFSNFNSRWSLRVKNADRTEFAEAHHANSPHQPYMLTLNHSMKELCMQVRRSHQK